MASFTYGSIHAYGATATPIDPGTPGATYSTGTLGDIDDSNDFLTDGQADTEFDIGGILNFLLDPQTGGPEIPISVTLVGSIGDFGGAPALVGYVDVGQLDFTYNIQGVFPVQADAAFPNGLYLVASPLSQAGFPPNLTALGVTSFDFDADMSTSTPIPECYLAGTAISTPDGSVAVEDLSIGDTVMTADGGTTRVKWIGRQTVSTMFGTNAGRLPVCIHAGAFGNGLPKRDLRITADHALLIDEVLISAGALVNGQTITWVPLQSLGERYTVYHVETATHDLILAEGTAAETYVDYAARKLFDNYDEYFALYGDEKAVPEMSYPRINTPRLVPQTVKDRLSKPSAA